MDNKHINKKKVSSETIDLIKKAASGDIYAKNLLIEQCANLVKYIVYRDFGSSSIDKEDLISIGYVGLTCAASKFFEKYHDKVIDGDADYYENFYNGKFIPYIYKSITNSILMELRKLSTSPKTISLDSPIFSGNDGGKDIKLSDAISDGKDFVSDFADEESIKKLYSLLKKLPDEDRKIIMLYFGFYNNIKVPINKIAQYLKVDESIIYKRIVDILENFRNELLSIEEKQVLDEKKDVIRLSENRTIYEYFKEYSHEEVDNAIALLNEDKKEILHKRFGNDFNIPVTSYSLDNAEERTLLDILYRALNLRLKNPANFDITIYDYFKEYSHEEVDNAISKLDEDDIKILHKRFGNDFNILVLSYSLDDIEKSKLSIILHKKIKLRLANPDKVFDKVLIYDYFKEYSHEEVDIVVSSLNENNKRILHKRFGDDFNIPVASYSLDKPERMLLSDVLNRTMKAKLKKLRNNNKTIYDYFKEYSKDEVDRAIHLLSENNKKVLCKIFGNNFNIPVSLYSLDKSEKRSLFALNSAIKKRLNSPVNSNKLIYDYFKEYSHEEVDNAISKLDENDIKILYKRFGDDFNISVLSYSLDDAERTRLASILQKKIKLRLSNPDKVFDKVLIYDYFKEYSHEEVNRAVATLNENNKRILHKRFGDDFNVPVTSYSLDKPERMLLSDVLNKTMKTRLKNPVNSNKLIYDYFKDYSYKEVNIAISKLDENDMKILHKRFGDDFNISVLSYSLNDVEKGKLGAILQQKIKARLDNPNKVFIKTLIYDYFEEYSHEEVDRAIFLLNENNKRILHKRFGDDFNIPVTSYSLDNSEKVLLYNVLYKAMKTKLKKLENYNKSSNDYQDKSKYVRKLKK